MNNSINRTEPENRLHAERQIEKNVTVKSGFASDIQPRTFWPQHLVTVASAVALIAFMASCDSELTGPDNEALTEDAIQKTWNGSEANQRPVTETVSLIFDEDGNPVFEVFGFEPGVPPSCDLIDTDGDHTHLSFLIKAPGLPETLKHGGWLISSRYSGLPSNYSRNYLAYYLHSAAGCNCRQPV